MRSRLVCFDQRPLKPQLLNTLRYFDLPNQMRFLPSTTPFVLPVRLVQSLLDVIEARENKPFAETFLKLGVTEFLLFGAFLLACRIPIDQLYDLTGSSCPAIWDRAANDQSIMQRIHEAEATQVPFFSVHRRAVPKLSQASRARIAAFWKRRHLVGSEAEGEELLLRVQCRN